MGHGVGRDEDLNSEINVVPFIDVMLVLLVIFMVTAPMLQQGVEVNLPKASAAPLKGKSEQIIVSVSRDGIISIGAGNKVPLAEVGKKVAAVLETRPQEDRRVFIKADKDINYGLVMELMGNLHSAGVTNIGLVSAPPEK
jgi:biopolymer transport protein TolR